MCVHLLVPFPFQFDSFIVCIVPLFIILVPYCARLTLYDFYFISFLTSFCVWNNGTYTESSSGSQCNLYAHFLYTLLLVRRATNYSQFCCHCIIHPMLPLTFSYSQEFLFVAQTLKSLVKINY